MRKPAESILGRDTSQRLCNRLLEVFARAGSDPSQKGFEFGEGLLNRREVWRIRRQKHEPTAFGFDGLFHSASQVNTQIIQDHELSRTQAGSEHLLNVDFKGGGIGSSIQDECFSHALHRQGRKPRHVCSVITGNLAHGPLSSGGVGVQGSHSNMRTGFIHKDQILTGEVARLLTPGGPCCFILFPGYERLFFRVQPRAALARLMLAGLTRRPVLASKSWQCSSRVASAWVSNCSLRLACKTAPFRAGRPGIALGKT